MGVPTSSVNFGMLLVLKLHLIEKFYTDYLFLPGSHVKHPQESKSDSRNIINILYSVGASVLVLIALSLFEFPKVHLYSC